MSFLVLFVGGGGATNSRDGKNVKSIEKQQCFVGVFIEEGVEDPGDDCSITRYTGTPPTRPSLKRNRYFFRCYLWVWVEGMLKQPNHEPVPWKW